MKMESLVYPPRLREGDRVIILSPSSKIDKAFLRGAVRRLKSWGLEPVLASHAGSSHGTYAGSIAQRLKDLQEAMDDPKARAILCSRGGYGAVHLVDKLEAKAHLKGRKVTKYRYLGLCIFVAIPLPGTGAVKIGIKAQKTRQPQQKHQMKIGIPVRAGIQPLHGSHQIGKQRLISRLLRQRVAQKLGQEKGDGRFARLKRNRHEHTARPERPRPHQTPRRPRHPLHLNRHERLQQPHGGSPARRPRHIHHKRNPAVRLREHIGYHPLVIISQSRKHKAL